MFESESFLAYVESKELCQTAIPEGSCWKIGQIFMGQTLEFNYLEDSRRLVHYDFTRIRLSPN